MPRMWDDYEPPAKSDEREDPPTVRIRTPLPERPKSKSVPPRQPGTLIDLDRVEQWLDL
ncbi:hypothetical protein IT407_03930 [Candidatus Uhrbacteria bacterium]|nr:hypothetical protein [Candidatus Uhrbacteria bacterium]